jgi:hypothetical protein
MEASIHSRFIKQRGVVKASLKRIQNFIQTGDRKLGDIQVTFEELPKLFDKFDIAQNELACLDDTDYSGDTESFEEEYCHVKAKFNELLHPADIHNSVYLSVVAILHLQRTLAVHTLNYEKLNCQHLVVMLAIGCILETLLKL